jgi:hypothetical protein
MSIAPLSFVMTSRSGVSYCAQILPKFRAVAEILKDKCQFAVLDHDVSPNTREKYGIFAVPSFYVFRGTILAAEYVGEREATPMLNFLRRITGPRVRNLETARETHDLLKSHGSFLILAGDEIDDDVKAVFEKVAENVSDSVPCAIAASPESLQQLGLEDGTFLRLHRLDDRKVIEYDLSGNVTFDSLRDFVIGNKTPLYYEHNPVVFRDLAYTGAFALLAFPDFLRKASMDSMHQTLERVVGEYKNALACVYCDVHELAGIVSSLGFSGKNDPVYAIARFTGGELRENYPYPENMLASPENIVRFVGRFLNMTAGAKAKSEEPVPGQAGPLFKLVGKEFSEAVLDQKVDVVTAVLVGSEENRSATLEMMNETATELRRQKVKTVVCYYIDLELNDTPGLKVGNWTAPVVLLWPAGRDKVPLLFEGDIDSVELLSGIRSHGKSKLRFKVPKEKKKREPEPVPESAPEPESSPEPESAPEPEPATEPEPAAEL